MRSLHCNCKYVLMDVPHPPSPRESHPNPLRRPRNTAKTSREAFRVALGRNHVALSKCCAKRASSSWEPLPCSNFTMAFPPEQSSPPTPTRPTASTSAASARPRLRATSEAGTPVVAWHMSESTQPKPARPSPAADRRVAGGARNASPCRRRTRTPAGGSRSPRGGGVAFKSTPTTVPPRPPATSAAHATCAHAPGWQPRSSTAEPGATSPNLRCASSSLNAERAAHPAARARAAHASSHGSTPRPRPRPRPPRPMGRSAAAGASSGPGRACPPAPAPALGGPAEPPARGFPGSPLTGASWSCWGVRRREGFLSGGEVELLGGSRT